MCFSQPLSESLHIVSERCFDSVGCQCWKENQIFSCHGFSPALSLAALLFVEPERIERLHTHHDLRSLVAVLGVLRCVPVCHPEGRAANCVDVNLLVSQRNLPT
jgi:hypothetical protein